MTPDRQWLFAHGAGFHRNRWALVSGRPIPVYRPPNLTLRGLVPMHDNHTLVSLNGDHVLGWDLHGRRRFSFDTLKHAYWLGVAPNNRSLVVIRGWDRIVTYDLPKGTVRWSTDSGPLRSYEVLAMVLPPHSKHLVTYHRNGFLRTTDLATGRLRSRMRLPIPDAVQRCVIRPDGRVLACAHPDGIDLTELPSGAPLGRVPSSGLLARAAAGPHPRLQPQRQRPRRADLHASGRGLQLRSPRGREAVHRRGGTSSDPARIAHRAPQGPGAAEPATQAASAGVQGRPAPLRSAHDQPWCISDWSVSLCTVAV